MSCEVLLEVVEEVFELLETCEKGDPGESVPHNNLSGIQGGIVTERYHLTTAEVAEIAANTLKVSFPEAPNDGKQYARESLAWSEVAAGGGGLWEPVTTETVSGAAVQEILFTGLDFTAYDYLITGLIEMAGLVSNNDSDRLRWYAVEANAAAVVAADYKSNKSRIVTSVQDSQAAANGLIYGNSKTLNVFMNSHVFSRSAVTGFTCHTGVGSATIRQDAITPYTQGLTTMNWNNNDTSAPTHLGVYHLDGAQLQIGTYLTLSRRAKT